MALFTKCVTHLVLIHIVLPLLNRFCTVLFSRKFLKLKLIFFSCTFCPHSTHRLCVFVLAVVVLKARYCFPCTESALGYPK